MLCLPLLAAPKVQNAVYDPLRLPDNFREQVVDLEVQDPLNRRKLPLRVYLPPQGEPAPTIVFSHGLGGSNKSCSYLGKHWSARGYVVVFIQHPGSDSDIWQSQSQARRMDALRNAASFENLKLRLEDVPRVIDRLLVWNTISNHPLYRRILPEQLGMAGHSFGAITTQWSVGQSAGALKRRPHLEPRLRAAIALSPSPPKRGDAKLAFADIDIPLMLMTGTADSSPIGGVEPQDRRSVYEALEPGNKYELVLDGAEHSAFTDGPLRFDQLSRNPNHHRAILAISTAFWDAHLRSNPAAKEWIEADGVRSVLNAKDTFKFK